MYIIYYYPRCVRVSRPELNAANGPHVIVCITHPSAIATAVPERSTAVDQLLITQREESATFDRILSLQSTRLMMRL